MTEDVLRTINDRRDFVINSLHSVVDTGYPIVDDGHSIVNIMRDFQDLRSGHSSLLLRQLVQPLQRILDISLSNQLLQILF